MQGCRAGGHGGHSGVTAALSLSFQWVHEGAASVLGNTCVSGLNGPHQEETRVTPDLCSFHSC